MQRPAKIKEPKIYSGSLFHRRIDEDLAAESEFIVFSPELPADLLCLFPR